MASLPTLDMWSSDPMPGLSCLRLRKRLCGLLHHCMLRVTFFAGESHVCSTGTAVAVHACKPECVVCDSCSICMAVVCWKVLVSNNVALACDVHVRIMYVKTSSTLAQAMQHTRISPLSVWGTCKNLALVLCRVLRRALPSLM